MTMEINKLLQKKGLTKYRLSVLSGVPHATLSELCSGKTNIRKCSAETVYKLAKALGVSMESLVEEAFKKTPSAEEIRENSYEYGLPEYLQQDLDAFKEGVSRPGRPFSGGLCSEHSFFASSSRSRMEGFFPGPLSAAFSVSSPRRPLLITPSIIP